MAQLCAECAVKHITCLPTGMVHLVCTALKALRTGTNTHSNVKRHVQTMPRSGTVTSAQYVQSRIQTVEFLSGTLIPRPVCKYVLLLLQRKAIPTTVINVTSLTLANHSGTEQNALPVQK